MLRIDYLRGPKIATCQIGGRRFEAKGMPAIYRLVTLLWLHGHGGEAFEVWDDQSPFGNPGGRAMHGRVQNWASFKTPKGAPMFRMRSKPDPDFTPEQRAVAVAAAGTVVPCDTDSRRTPAPGSAIRPSDGSPPGPAGGKVPLHGACRGQQAGGGIGLGHFIKESDMALTPKQKVFAQEYLIDLNAKAAAIRAGYSAKTAKQKGYALLQNDQIAETVEAAIKVRSERTEVDQDWIIERLVENVERAMQIKPVLDGQGKPTSEHAYQGSVANKALELLGRHQGMFTDNIKLSGGLRTTHEEALKELE